MDEMDQYDIELLKKHKATTGSELDGPDLYTRSEFTCGYCAIFAAAIHDRTGWEIFSEYHDETLKWVEHVWVVNPDGHAIDVNGVHKNNYAKTPFSEDTTKYIVPFRREDCVNEKNGTSNDKEVYQWANEVIDNYPDLYCIEPKPVMSI